MKLYHAYSFALCAFFTATAMQKPTSSLELLNATKYNDMETAKKLIEAGTEVNEQSHRGETPLFYAVSNLNLPIVKLLLEKKANPNIQTSNECGYNGMTPLMLGAARAIKENFSTVKEIIQSLLEANADQTVHDSLYRLASFHVCINFNISEAQQDELLTLCANNDLKKRKEQKP